MKIINIPYETIYKCDECGCEFEIENGDVIYNKIWVQSIDKPYEYITKISTTCPFCNNEIDIKRKES